MAWSAEQEIGPYRLVRRLGRGGFAEVWLAELSAAGGFRRQLAVKLVLPGDEIGDDLKADVLLHEARLTSWLQDPHIVTVERVSVEDGVFVLAMEYCDGGTASSLMQGLRALGLPMPPSVAVDLGLHVARALAAAHNAVDPEGRPLCVVHRDLKPSNVLLTLAGLAKVCDFGIAKATGETNSTSTGILKGTTAYIAPELWEDVHAFSPASDLFALGTLLAELTTLRPLHGGGSMPQVYRRIASGDATEDALRVAPYLPPLVPLLEDLLRRNPAERISDAREVVRRLERLRADLDGSGDLALALALLDLCDKGGGRSACPLPPRVDRAWQVITLRATGRRLPLVPGPAGAADLWELAVVPIEGAQQVQFAAAPPAGTHLSAGIQLPAPQGLSTGGSRGRRRRRRQRASTLAVLGVVLALVLGVGIGSLGVFLLGRRGPPATTETKEGPERQPADVTVALGNAPDPPGNEGPLAPRPAPPAPPGSLRPGLEPPRAAQTARGAERPRFPADPTTPPLAPAEPATELETPEEETPAPPPEPEPAAPCLGVASRPPGAHVWLDGTLLPDRARSQPMGGRRWVAGRHVVSMSLLEDGERVTGEVVAQPGESVVVRCYLVEGGSCTTERTRSDLCR